jgi:GTPase SAR1 family protein
MPILHLRRRVDFSKGVKLCFLGEAGVGKSSVVSRYVKNTFDEHQPPTVGYH